MLFSNWGQMPDGISLYSPFTEVTSAPYRLIAACRDNKASAAIGPETAALRYQPSSRDIPQRLSAAAMR
jgi:hypothetical protein